MSPSKTQEEALPVGKPGLLKGKNPKKNLCEGEGSLKTAGESETWFDQLNGGLFAGNPPIWLVF